MKWNHPHIIKIYEAAGAVADGRIEVSGDTAKVYSSSRNKYYDVVYDPETNSIMANDNSSYWNGDLGYPAIAFLMETDVLSYDQKTRDMLQNIAWKDINQKFKNDFEKTLEHILYSKSEKEKEEIAVFVEKINKEIRGLDLNLLGKKNFLRKGISKYL